MESETNNKENTMETVVYMYPQLFCDSCGKVCSSSVPFEKSGILNGSTIEITGGYAEFFDAFPDEDLRLSLVACHDCTLQIFRFFMASEKYAAFKHEYQGHSHYAGDTHCCEYSYNADDHNALLEETQAFLMGENNESK